jgi:uncharacterized protein (UPF0212 family)
MEKKVYTHEEELAICEAYRDKNNTVLDIIDKFGLSDHKHLRKILNKYDVPPRNAYAPRKRHTSLQTGQRKCPKCGKAIEQSGARFCWYCGADVRTPKMAAIEGLERCVLGNLELVTPAVRDEMAEAVRNAIKLLKEE